MKHVYLMMMLSFYATTGSAGTDPTPQSKDHRIRTIAYNANDVVHLLAHYGYTLTVEFAPDELITDRVFGDPDAWEFLPNRNRAKIRPVQEDATTNLTIWTNRRTYIYEIRATNAKSPRTNDLTYYLRYTYPGDESHRAMLKQANLINELDEKKEQQAANTVLNPTDLYFGYSYAGESEIAPLQTFDDGRFTYFKFRDKSPLPTIYTADKQRNDALVNYHLDGAYVVIEQLASRFTLRNGQQVVSVIRNQLPGLEAMDTSKGGVDQNKHIKNGNVGGSGHADW